MQWIWSWVLLGFIFTSHWPAGCVPQGFSPPMIPACGTQTTVNLEMQRQSWAWIPRLRYLGYDVGGFPSLPVTGNPFGVTCHRLRLVLHCCVCYVVLCYALLCLAMLCLVKGFLSQGGSFPARRLSRFVLGSQLNISGASVASSCAENLRRKGGCAFPPNASSTGWPSLVMGGPCCEFRKPPAPLYSRTPHMAQIPSKSGFFAIS